MNNYGDLIRLARVLVSDPAFERAVNDFEMVDRIRHRVCKLPTIRAEVIRALNALGPEEISVGSDKVLGVYLEAIAQKAGEGMQAQLETAAATAAIPGDGLEEYRLQVFGRALASMMNRAARIRQAADDDMAIAGRTFARRSHPRLLTPKKIGQLVREELGLSTLRSTRGPKEIRGTKFVIWDAPRIRALTRELQGEK